MSELNERLEKAVADRPPARHLIDLRIVARAVLIAVALTVVCWILFSPAFAAVVLVLSFFASWIFMGTRSYERRRPTQPAASSREDGPATP